MRKGGRDGVKSSKGKETNEKEEIWGGRKREEEKVEGRGKEDWRRKEGGRSEGFGTARGLFWDLHFLRQSLASQLSGDCPEAQGPVANQPMSSPAAGAWNPRLNRESSFYCQEHVPVSSKSINSLITLSGARCQAAVRER